VSRLTAALPLAFSAQASRSWLFQPIAARWLATIAAVLRQLVTQLLNLPNLFCQLLLQPDDNHHKLIFIQSGQLFRFERFHHTSN